MTTTDSVRPDAASTTPEAFTTGMIEAFWSALGGDPAPAVTVRDGRILPAPFGVSHLGAASFGVAGAAIAELLAEAGEGTPEVEVDLELASAWMVHVSQPVGGWTRGTPWHDVSQFYEAADGRFVRLQANYPHLRRATAAALEAAEERQAFADAIRSAPADEIEQRIVDGGGAAAASRSVADWQAHPQGIAVAAEPLVERFDGGAVQDSWRPVGGRPLAGIRVLDITRVLAGPMATRFLAGYGAEVLRIDPPGYQEVDGRSGGELVLGKRCAYLPLENPEGRAVFLELLRSADVFVHGLRPGALDGLGLGEDVRRELNPGLVEVTLDAYGWSGPWAGRRGFDTLVQTSEGIAVEIGERARADLPQLMPAQVLDHATGYIMAAAAIRGLTTRLREGRGSGWRLALARTGGLLIASGEPPAGEAMSTLPLDRIEPRVHVTPSGAVRRLPFPVSVADSPLYWERAGDPYGTSTPVWATPAAVGRYAG